MGKKNVFAQFYVLEHSDPFKIVFFLPDNGAQVKRRGRGHIRFSQKPKFDIFFSDGFPKITF